MNYYGSQEHLARLEAYDRRIFSQCDFSEPTKEYAINGEYLVKTYALEDESTGKPYHTPESGSINRLFREDKQVFEWRYLGMYGRNPCIVQHANGKSYLLFYECLYGYSVLDLASMESVRYIPWESGSCDEHFEETFIWCVPRYDRDSNLLAVEGTIWGAPNSVIVLDFSDPMRIVEAKDWLDVRGGLGSGGYDDGCDDIETAAWEADRLVCEITAWEADTQVRSTLTVSKRELLERLTSGTE